MDISSIANSAVTPATYSPAAPPNDTSGAAPATAADSVTLSPAAQQILTTPSATSASQPLTWQNDTVTSALAALNDTKTAIADQITAYKSLASLVTDAKNFDPTKAENAKAVDVATAFSTSAFVQHYEELAAQFGAFNHDQNSDHFGKDLSDMQQRQLNYFNSLSANDQQTLIGTYNASLTVIGAKPPAASVDQYKADTQTRIDITRSLEAVMASPPYADEIAAHKSEIIDSGIDTETATLAVLRQKAEASGDVQTLDLLKIARGNMSDDYKAAVKTYFDTYGPAPAQSEAQKAADAAAAPRTNAYKAPSASAVHGFFQDIATLADSSGTTPATDLVGAYKAVWSKASASSLNARNDVFWMVGWSAGMTATGSKQIQKADTTWNDAGWAGRGGSHVSDAQSYYSSFEKLSDFDQQLVGALRGSPWNSPQSNATPDDFRSQLVDGIANAAQGDAITALYQAENYGHLTAKSTVTILGVTLNLNSIMASNDKHLDPYTRMSADVKALLKEAAAKWAAGEKVSIDATKLYAAPPSDAEKALAALKAYAAGTAPKSDDEKALAKLKAAAAAGDTAAVTLLKQAAEAQAKADADKKDADKGATDKDQTKSATASSATDAKPVPAVSQTSTATPASVSLQA